MTITGWEIPVVIRLTGRLFYLYPDVLRISRRPGKRARRRRTDRGVYRGRHQGDVRRFSGRVCPEPGSCFLFLQGSARGYVARASDLGWTDAEIAQATQETAVVNVNNLMAEGFGYPPDWMRPYNPAAKPLIDTCGTEEERKPLINAFVNSDSSSEAN